MTSMRQLTYVSPNKVEWREVVAPTLQSDVEALVRPLAVARCDLDLGIITGRTGWPGPFALGHETAGEVIAIGDNVKTVRPGDRVILPFQISCGACDPCRQGLTSNCNGVPRRSMYGMAGFNGVEFGGGLSDVIRVPFADHMLLPQPADMEAEVAAGVGDNISDGYRLVMPDVAASPGARILIIGGRFHSICLYAAQAAKAFGAAEVVYVDRDPARLALARTLGITVVEREALDGRAPNGPYQIVLDGSGTPEGIAYAIRSTAHGGVCRRTYGDDSPLTPVPLRDMYGIGVSLQMSVQHVRTRMPEVLGHVCAGRLHPELLTTRHATFAEAAEAIFEPSVKIVFSNEEGSSYVRTNRSAKHL